MTRRFTPAILLIAAMGFPTAVVAEPTLSDDDAWMIQDSAQSSLEFAKTNQTTVWQNPDTGASGTITPVDTYQNDQGEYCREYQQTVTIGGQQQQAYGTACRKPDGAWEIVSSQPVDPPQPAPTVVYRDAVVYQPVPVPFPRYGVPVFWPFALNFSWYGGRWGASVGWGGYPYGYYRGGSPYRYSRGAYYNGYYRGYRGYRGYRYGKHHGWQHRQARHGGNRRGHDRGGHKRGGSRNGKRQR